MEWIAGDIGGTKTWLAWAADAVDGTTRWRYEHVYASNEQASLEALLHTFMADADMRSRPDGLIVAVPGPVREGRARLTNLDWDIDVAALQSRLGIPHVRVVNDFEAAAAGLETLAPGERIALNAGVPEEGGVTVLTGAGTGLGLAFMVNDAAGHRRSYATEGGHIDFAPAGEQQARLLARLRQRHGHVSWERVASGSALPELYTFCGDEHGLTSVPERDAAGVAAAAETGDVVARAALALFTAIYGAWVGNVALLYRPRGGLYIAGGVSTHLQAHLLSPAFMDAARDKGRMRPVVESTPIFLVTTGRLGVQGAFEMRPRQVPDTALSNKNARRR